MATFKDEEDARPGYKGEIVWDIIGSGQRKVIWGSKTRPPKWAVILGLVSMISCLVGGVYVIRQIVTSVGGINKQIAELIISVLTAFQIELLNAVVKRFAIRSLTARNIALTRHEAALITKVFLPIYEQLLCVLLLFSADGRQNDPELRCSKYSAPTKCAPSCCSLAVHCFIVCPPSWGYHGFQRRYYEEVRHRRSRRAGQHGGYDPSLGPLEDCEQIALQFGHHAVHYDSSVGPDGALFFNLVEMRLEKKSAF